MAEKITEQSIKDILKDKFETTDVEVIDISGGCGSSFEVYIVSFKFQNKTLIQRHKLVHEALHYQMKHIHALSIKKCALP